MIHIPGALIFLTWVLIGPVSIHHDLPMLILPAFAMSILGIGVLMRRSSREQSIALLSVLGIMFFESLQSIGRWLHIEVVHSPFIEGEEVRHFISFFFTLNAGLAAIGAVAALGVALSLQVRKAGLPLTRLFPEMQFATATSEVIRAVERLSKVAGIPPPNVSIIDSGDPAAFITHSKQGYVLAVSVGLLESMNADELDACLAHELAHLKNNDFAVRSFATTAKVALFAHPLSHIIEPAVYRARELLADRTAVRLVGGRFSLISALSKIRESQDYVVAHPGSLEMACLFNHSPKNGILRLFDKHPTLESRIEALQKA